MTSNPQSVSTNPPTIVIYKYPLIIGHRDNHRTRTHLGYDRIHVRMPFGAKILSLQVQHMAPTIWAEVDITQRDAFRAFVFVPTGGYVPAKSTFIGMVQIFASVWHVYEET